MRAARKSTVEWKIELEERTSGDRRSTPERQLSLHDQLLMMNVAPSRRVSLAAPGKVSHAVNAAMRRLTAKEEQLAYVVHARELAVLQKSQTVPTIEELAFEAQSTVLALCTRLKQSDAKLPQDQLVPLAGAVHQLIAVARLPARVAACPMPVAMQALRPPRPPWQPSARAALGAARGMSCISWLARCADPGSHP